MRQMPDRNAWISPFLAVVIILAGVAARLYQISYNLDPDEVWYFSTVRGSFREALGAALTDWPHPPLHYILLWAWLKLTGPSEIGLRLLSVIASAAFLVVLWRLASRLASPAGALFALFLCATSPFFVYYGWLARPYALIQLFATLSLFFLLRAFAEPGVWRWALLWGASCVALLYTQYLGALLLLPQLVAISIRPLPDRRRLLNIGILAAACILPWVVAVRLTSPVGLEPPDFVGNTDWIQRPGAWEPVGYFVDIFGWLWPGTTRFLLGLSAVTLLSLAVRRGASVPEHLPLIVALAAFPPTILFFVSRFGPVSVWVPRQTIGSMVFLLLLFGIALSLHRRWIGAVLAAGFATWLALTIHHAFPENTKPPWRAIGARLEAEFRSPVVGEDDLVLLPLKYYSRADIRRVDDYPPGQCCGPQLVFICRPSRCAEFAKLQAQYEQVAHEEIQWEPAYWQKQKPPTQRPLPFLNLYVLRQRS